LTNNLGAKMLAVVVALLVWFNASGQEEVSRVRSVPLTLEGLPDSLALAAPVPATAAIRVTATRRQLVALGFQRLSVVADISGFESGGSADALGRTRARAGDLDRGEWPLAPSVLR
jgi:hypothetical protein